jgi:phosphoribosylanthranilate isomerase
MNAPEMSGPAIATKICGLTTAEAVDAAREHGAAFVGLVFYPRSPRHVSPAEAADLARRRGAAQAVAVTVDLDDAGLAEILETAEIDLLQLHGAETPARVAAVRARFGVPVMKSVAVAGPDDLTRAHAYAEVADRLLFDAKPPKDKADALPGGNARAFDWDLLAGRSWPRPWMLSGGLHAGNVAQALRVSGAPALDVSSGVEAAPGRKDPAKIAELLRAVATAGR